MNDKYLKTIREISFIKLFNDNRKRRGKNYKLKKLSKYNLKTSTIPINIINDIFP